MKHEWPNIFASRLIRLVLLTTVCVSTLPGFAQSTAADQNALASELKQLRAELAETRAELARTRSQIEALDHQMTAIRAEVGAKTRAVEASPGPAYPSAADVAHGSQPEAELPPSTSDNVVETQRLLAAQVAEQHQTKVETASRYRVRISGLVLFNAFSNSGGVDTVDDPKIAIGSAGASSVGASVRQSILGLQVIGPELAGAATSARMSVDFAGGYQQSPYGTSIGILRLREASAHFDWRNTSVTIGQEMPFFSPLSPTSYATLAEPAFSYSGNLWAWTPQVAVQHRLHFSDDTFFSANAGILAPSTERVPQGAYVQPGPGERSRRPAFGTDLAFQSKVFGQPLEIGVGGYFSHLRFRYGQETDSWAVTSHWRFPLGSMFELSGEAYRGLAVGGLGGGIWQSVVYDAAPGIPSTTIRPLNALGGWTQLKFQPRPKWEANAAVGQDNVFARDLRFAPELVGAYMPVLARNRAAFGNVIFRPKSNLLLSLEYRRIWTFGYTGPPDIANQVNVAAGVSF